MEQQVLHPHQVEPREGAVKVATQGRGRGCWTVSELYLRRLADKVGGEIPDKSRLVEVRLKQQLSPSTAAVQALLSLERREKRLRNRRVNDRNEAEVDPLLAEVTDGSQRVRGEGEVFGMMRCGWQEVRAERPHRRGRRIIEGERGVVVVLHKQNLFYYEFQIFKTLFL